jgi:hypothetical protein
MKKELNNYQFVQWFVGFAEAEGCFKIKPRYRNGKFISFGFEFEIHLHADDFKLLEYIKERLNLGNVYLNTNRNTCNLVVGSEKELREIIKIFDSFPLNGIKYLDFIDFKEAFFLYFSRKDTISQNLINQLLKIKEGLNKSRVDFIMPQHHKINITGYWLAGLIDGEGSFSMTRGLQLRLCFQLLFTAAQKPLLEAIKTFLINNLEFDRFSLWKLDNSSVIGIFDIKAKGNSKPTVCLEIRNVRILHNHFLPFLSNFPLLSKKNLDLADFIILCQTIYKGLHKNSLIRELLIKLSLRMNDFRLSSYKKDPEYADLTQEEFAKLSAAINAETSLNLVKDAVYLIRKIDLEGTGLAEKELLVDSLKEASKIVGVSYSKLSKLLDCAESKEVKLNNYTIKRAPIFNG